MTEPRREDIERRVEASSRSENIGAVGPAHLREVMGPFGPDSAMRQAVATIWRYLPEGSRSMERVEEEARRLLERSLRDLREDFGAFRP